MATVELFSFQWSMIGNAVAMGLVNAALKIPVGVIVQKSIKTATTVVLVANKEHLLC